MTAPLELSHRLTQRLLPLYIAAFLQSCVFWYSIEKLFMTSIGFTPLTIALMATAYSIVILGIETPSGIIADRTSRKGMLIVASIMLAVSSLIQGLSHSVVTYILGAMAWGVYAALYSGIYDPIVYDTLLEEAGHTNGFKRYFGWVKSLDGLGLVIGSLIGALLGANFGLRASFFWTIPVSLLAAGSLIVFREPTLHKAEVSQSIIKHLRVIFTAALHRGSLFGILLILVIGTTLTELIFEFTQLWLIATHSPITFYGPSTAVVLSTIGFSGIIAPYLRMDKRLFVAFFSTIMLLSCSLLIAARNPILLVISQSIIVIGLLSTGIIYMERFHDRLPSGIRSGASSAISTIGRVIFIGMALAFGFVTSHASIFHASWLILLPMVFICAFLIRASTIKLGPSNDT